jgi:hypothetical protein
MNELLGLPYYIPDIFNLHIMSTPNRRIITRYLSEEAIKKNYKPIILGIYGNEGNKYHLQYDDQDYEVSHIMDNGEFNIKIEKVLEHLKIKGVNINRPFIIIGNYTPTGESLSFVNYKYGTVRGNIRLISTNAEEDYQEACRNNYMTTKFIEQIANWTMPEKYLIGHEKFINNALSYEKENDARIDELSSRDNDNITNTIVVSSTEPLPDSGGIVAIPIKITIDRSDPEVKRLIETYPSSKDIIEKTIKENLDLFEANPSTAKFRRYQFFIQEVGESLQVEMKNAKIEDFYDLKDIPKKYIEILKDNGYKFTNTN